MNATDLDTTADGIKLYPILNSSSNGVKFSQYAKDSIYIFKIRIVDPDYSYCDLSAEIALDLYGAPQGLGTLIQILVIFTMIIIVILAASYVYFWQVLGLGDEE